MTDIPTRAKYVVWVDGRDGCGWEPTGYETVAEVIDHIDRLDSSQAYYVTTAPLKVTTETRIEEPDDER